MRKNELALDSSLITSKDFFPLSFRKIMGSTSTLLVHSTRLLCQIIGVGATVAEESAFHVLNNWDQSYVYSSMTTSIFGNVHFCYKDTYSNVNNTDRSPSVTKIITEVIWKLCPCLGLPWCLIWEWFRLLIHSWRQEWDWSWRGWFHFSLYLSWQFHVWKMRSFSSSDHCVSLGFSIITLTGAVVKHGKFVDKSSLIWVHWREWMWPLRNWQFQCCLHQIFKGILDRFEKI